MVVEKKKGGKGNHSWAKGSEKESHPRTRDGELPEKNNRRSKKASTKKSEAEIIGEIAGWTSRGRTERHGKCGREISN